MCGPVLIDRFFLGCFWDASDGLYYFTASCISWVDVDRSRQDNRQPLESIDLWPGSHKGANSEPRKFDGLQLPYFLKNFTY
jgi:hypothetical protein